MREHLSLRHESPERLIDQFFSRIYVAEHVLPQDEVTSIHPDIGVFHALDRVHVAIIAHLDGIEAAGAWLHGEKRGVAIATREFVNQMWQVEVR